MIHNSLVKWKVVISNDLGILNPSPDLSIWWNYCNKSAEWLDAIYSTNKITITPLTYKSGVEVCFKKLFE